MTETLTISRVGAQGDGNAETPTGPVFVPLTLAGETVRGEVVDGRLEGGEILTASPERIAPVSPHYGDCGGCQYQHLNYATQLRLKQKQVAELFQRVGQFDPGLVGPVVLHLGKVVALP